MWLVLSIACRRWRCPLDSFLIWPVHAVVLNVPGAAPGFWKATDHWGIQCTGENARNPWSLASKNNGNDGNDGETIQIWSGIVADAWGQNYTLCSKHCDTCNTHFSIFLLYNSNTYIIVLFVRAHRFLKCVCGVGVCIMIFDQHERVTPVCVWRSLSKWSRLLVNSCSVLLTDGQLHYIIISVSALHDLTHNVMCDCQQSW